MRFHAVAIMLTCISHKHLMMLCCHLFAIALRAVVCWLFHVFFSLSNFSQYKAHRTSCPEQFAKSSSVSPTHMRCGSSQAPQQHSTALCAAHSHSFVMSYSLMPWAASMARANVFGSRIHSSSSSFQISRRSASE